MFEDDDDRVVRTRVKICGLTTREDAEAAIEFGADALGFNFFDGSRRFIPIEASRQWIAALPSSIAKVAVLVNPTWDDALSVAKLPGLTALQLHGMETPEFCRGLAELGVRFVKALPVTTLDSIRKLPSFFTRTVLLDSKTECEFGGSGKTFPWELGRVLVRKNPNLRVILAGGLTPENVAEAVAAVRPFAVDVTSGVEASPGRKDYARMRAFIAAAQSR